MIRECRLVILFFLILLLRREYRFVLLRGRRVLIVLGFFLYRLHLLKDALQKNVGECDNVHLAVLLFLLRKKLFFVGFLLRVSHFFR